MPATCDVQAGELRDMLQDVPVQISPAMIDQISTLEGFQIEVCLARPAWSTPMTAVNQKLNLLEDALLNVVGKSVCSHQGLAGPSTLRWAFQRDVSALRSHELHHVLFSNEIRVVRRQEIHEKPVLLVNDGLSKWASGLFDAAVSAGQRWNSPPNIAHFPAVVVPAWESMDAYIALGKPGNEVSHMA